jgi:uncharacterized membrane protein YkvA (DUF1232 family)
MWSHIVIGVAIGLVLTWVVLLIVLWRASPEKTSLQEALHLLPDVLRLLHRLARDHTLPRGVRVRLWLVLAYLAMPIDLVPDFIPVVGYADDAAVIVLALRSVSRRAGRAALERHWPGSPDGLNAIIRLAGLA